MPAVWHLRKEHEVGVQQHHQTGTSVDTFPLRHPASNVLQRHTGRSRLLGSTPDPRPTRTRWEADPAGTPFHGTQHGGRIVGGHLTWGAEQGDVETGTAVGPVRPLESSVGFGKDDSNSAEMMEVIAKTGGKVSHSHHSALPMLLWPSWAASQLIHAVTSVQNARPSAKSPRTCLMNYCIELRDHETTRMKRRDPPHGSPEIRPRASPPMPMLPRWLAPTLRGSSRLPAETTVPGCRVRRVRQAFPWATDETSH